MPNPPFDLLCLEQDADLVRFRPVTLAWNFLDFFGEVHFKSAQLKTMCIFMTNESKEVDVAWCITYLDHNPILVGSVYIPPK